MNKSLEIDNVDLSILKELMQDAKMPYTEIAKKINISGGTVHVRMRQLEKMKIVKGATLDLNFSLLGYDITAFLGVFLEKSSLYHKVCDQLEKIPEILSIHYTTGDYSIFTKLVCKDTDHLRKILHDKIQCIRGISRTETFISLEERINRPLPIPENIKNL